tara:strand:- start:1155 stop:1505 length:351 start_codon:yes stop_codon:yes gene_type:complete
MGDLVDLDAFRKQREEEEKIKQEAEAAAKEAEEEAEVEYMQNLLHSIMANLSDLYTGSTYYTNFNNPYDNHLSYSSDDYMFNTYYHEAGYDDDGYYERSWEADPRDFLDNDDEEDF